MCYALLSTCSLCTWLHTITYPRCSHARAYAISPPACPHRMQRRSKPDGLCEACKVQVKTRKPKTQPAVPKANAKHQVKLPSEKAVQQRRKDSLSITPCDVRIHFRDTEVGVVEERDKVRAVDPNGETALEETKSRDEGTNDHKPGPITTRRTRRARLQGKPLITQGASDEDTDADVYIDSESTTASISTAATLTSDEDLVPWKRGPRTKKRAQKYAPQRIRQGRRSRSPGAFERLHAIDPPAAVKKGRRGRPPKQKIIWPDRIDAGAFDQVVQERNRMKVRGRAPRGRPARRDVNLTARSPVQSKEAAPPLTYFEKTVCGSQVIEKPKPGYQRESQMPAVDNVGKSGICSRDETIALDGESDLARIIALEALQRDKKWR